ncbi:MAG: flagellar hook-associated protein FlgL [Methylococcaceae bacterium]
MRISTATLRDTGVSNLMFRQVEMNRSQEEMASGLKLLKPSDDPAAMASVLDFKASIDLNTRFQANISAVQLRLNNEETALDSASNIMYRVRELTVTGLNASYNGSDREAIGREIHEMTRALLDVANTKNDRGEYLFAGSRSEVKPFDFDTTSPELAVSYRGDKYQRKIQVGPDILMNANHNGFSVFENVPTVDSSVTVAPVSTTATATPTADAGGEVALPEDATASSASSSTAVTDTTPPTRSIFNTLLKLEAAFTGNLSDSDVHDIATAGLQDLDAGLKSLSDARVEVGARLSTLDQQNNILEKFTLDSKQNLSDLQDADYAQVISQFNLHQTALQASQQAYMKVQSLSLFNYL